MKEFFKRGSKKLHPHSNKDRGRFEDLGTLQFTICPKEKPFNLIVKNVIEIHKALRNQLEFKSYINSIDLNNGIFLLKTWDFSVSSINETTLKTTLSSEYSTQKVNLT